MPANSNEASWFPAAAFTGSGRPVLHPNEVECQLLSAVDVIPQEGSDSFPSLRAGVLILTTDRLIWYASIHNCIAIPLTAITYIFSPQKSLFHSPRVRFKVSINSKSVVVLVVSRGKEDFDVFFKKLRENWERRINSYTENEESGLNTGSSSGSDGFYSRDGSVRMMGLSGILKKEQEMWESTDKSLHEAFKDLNALMNKAKEMVLLAEKMRQKLFSDINSKSSKMDDEEINSNQEMQDWLLSVGIVSPVTKESAGALYHQQLSLQLADFVKLPLERAGGMINLIDVYCLFNRARGTELISPEDLVRACSLWEKCDVPIMLRKFDSGVIVIQNKSHCDEEVLAQIKALGMEMDFLRNGITARDAALTLGVAPALAKEHLLAAESRGLLCRDISPDGFHFFFNIFPEISPRDPYLVEDNGIYAMWVAEHKYFCRARSESNSKHGKHGRFPWEEEEHSFVG